MSEDFLESELWMLALAWCSGVRLSWRMIHFVFELEMRRSRIRVKA